MSPAPVINSSELYSLISDEPTFLIDVRLADDFDAEHLEGAFNNCVFEVAFLSRMEESFLDRDATICVYGSSASSHESRVAAEKLKLAGYTKIFEFRDGIEGWKNEGFQTEVGSPLASEESLFNGTLAVDLSESRVEWLGRNLINKHWGTIPLKSGKLHFADGSLTGGEFVLNLKAIECTDLAGSELHDVLIHHLQSDDFFDTENHPEIRIVIDSAEPIEDRGPGAPNLRLYSRLTMRGVTRGISFNATVGRTGTGQAAAQAAFAIDRTNWNIIYGSGKFFKRLAGHLVNDMIELQIRIITA